MMGTYKARYILGRQLAGTAVSIAVKTGVLVNIKKLMCVDCGKQADHYEHRDYNKPLDVEPTCRSCNFLRGPAKRLSKIPAKYKDRLSKIDKKIMLHEKERRRKLTLRYDLILNR